jgi:DNA-binding transcriptional regulator GbsR (MarR family)
MFSELTGMALRHISPVPVEISLMPDSIKKHKALQKKKPYFYASAVSIILCLLVFYWVVSKKRDYDKKCVEEVQAEVEKLEDISSEVRTAGNNLASVVGEYEKVMQMTNKRSEWINVLNELQEIIPDKWWLTSLTASNQKQAKAVRRSSNGRSDRPGSESMFGDTGMGRSSSTPINNVELKWLRLVGHSIALKNDLLFDEVRQRVKKSKYFDNSDDAVLCDSYEIIRGDNNFINFEIQIKLKTPIKK